MVHLGRLKPPRKAAGQMDLLTVPSGDGADMRSRQDVHVVTTLTSHVTTVNNALGPTSTLSNPNLYATSQDRDTSVDLGGPKTVPGTSPRAPTTSATARFYTGALDEVISSGTPRAPCGSGLCGIPTQERLVVRNSDPQYPRRITILFRTI